MSITPNGLLPCGNEPTSVNVPGLESPAFAASERQSFPHGYRQPDVPRAANSHSSSVGNRFLAHCAYAVASYQSTPVTGFLAEPRGKLPLTQFGGGLWPAALINFSYSSFETSLMSILKGF